MVLLLEVHKTHRSHLELDISLNENERLASDEPIDFHRYQL